MQQQNRPGNFITTNIPLVIAVLATFIPVWLIEATVLSHTNGVFMYPLDDPFIHMEVAKNLASSGTWGINPYEFGSASSSILYTLLLAFSFKIVGAHVLVPFIINCIAALILLVVMDRWLKKQDTGVLGRTVILLLAIVFCPLPVMIISGMEHTLHCLFMFLFLTRFSSWLQQLREGVRSPVPVLLIVYTVLIAAIRYEGLFVVGIASLLLAWYRNIGKAVLLTGLAFVPVLLFGLFSMAKGSYFLPNSVLVKSETMQLSPKGILEFLNNILVFKLTAPKTTGNPIGSPPPGISLLVTQRLLIILPVIYFMFSSYLKGKKIYSQLLLLLTLSTLVHLALAATGWFYRYEAYLVLPAVVIISVIVAKHGREWITGASVPAKVMAGVLAFALFFPFILRSAAAYTKASQACINIYEQQYQVGQFIHQSYDKDVMAANDIGAISFSSQVNMVDLWGLGSIDVARSRKGKYWTPQFLDSLAHSRNVKLAVVYDEWFDPELLKRWTKVATWQIQDNVICGGDTVSFYSIDPANAAELKQRLMQYQPLLPSRVIVAYK